jgi:hypothetical protein
MTPKAKWWKKPSTEPKLSGKQALKKEFEYQLVCRWCKGENFKIFRGRRPEVDKTAYLVMCVHCGKPKWMQGDRY